MLPIRKRKSIGQHLLVDKKTIDNICNFIIENLPSSKYTLLEIGSSEGILTIPLLKKLSITTEKIPKLVILNEIDYRYSKKLKEKLEKENLQTKFKIEILNKDFQIVDLKNPLITNQDPLFIVGNIPFYITGQVIRKIIDNDQVIQGVVLNLQKEVVDKLTKINNPLGIVFRIGWEINKGIIIPPQFYDPPPKVFSQLIAIKKLNYQEKNQLNISKFLKFLYKLFNNKRKKIKNILTKNELEKIKEYENLRVEKLKIEDLIKIFQTIY
jgi:16S rRNA (adenine1518-N6/adenine1519-N6)-dimethyltransferase